MEGFQNILSVTEYHTKCDTTFKIKDKKSDDFKGEKINFFTHLLKKNLKTAKKLFFFFYKLKKFSFLHFIYNLIISTFFYFASGEHNYYVSTLSRFYDSVTIKTLALWRKRNNTFEFK